MSLTQPIVQYERAPLAPLRTEPGLNPERVRTFLPCNASVFPPFFPAEPFRRFSLFFQAKLTEFRDSTLGPTFQT